jgi:hypothetical protein
MRTGSCARTIVIGLRAKLNTTRKAIVLKCLIFVALLLHKASKPPLLTAHKLCNNMIQYNIIGGVLQWSATIDDRGFQ